MKFRCGLIGLGRIGCGFDDDSKSIKTHAGAYSSNPKTDLVAICDIDKQKLEKYGNKYGIDRRYTDLESMLEREKLDLLSICTLSDSHLKIVEKAVKHNIKGIFLEKPISDSLESASKIVKLCRDAKIKLQIDHQRRFDPFYQEIKKLLKTDPFIKIQNVNIYYGGGISNTGSHLFDLIRLFFGDIAWVEGCFAKNALENPNDPNIDGKIVCKNDISCYLHSVNFNNYRLFELDVLGSNGRLKIDLTKSTAEYFTVKEIKNGQIYKALTPSEFVHATRTDAIVLGLEDLCESIENNREPLCSGEDGRASLEITMALLNSANQNCSRINLPLTTNTYKILSK
jgi:predicted dehydrogenase